MFIFIQNPNFINSVLEMNKIVNNKEKKEKKEDGTIL